MKRKWVVVCSLLAPLTLTTVMLLSGGNAAVPLFKRASSTEEPPQEPLASPNNTKTTSPAVVSPSAPPPLPKSSFKAGKHYAVLPVSASSKPQIIEFFSFYCVQCYRLQHEHQLSEALAGSLPPDGQFKQYHISLLGPLAKELTRAWAVAITLGIEKKMNPILFDGIQKQGTLNTPEDIRQAFINAGINPSAYDNALDSFLVNSLITQQEQAIQEAKIGGVPALVVNKKYRVHPENFSVRNGFPEFTRQYLQLVKQLLTTVDH